MTIGRPFGLLEGNSDIGVKVLIGRSHPAFAAARGAGGPDGRGRRRWAMLGVASVDRPPIGRPQPEVRVLFGGDLLGGDPIPWLVLALGGALAVGTGLALVRTQGDPGEDDLDRPPLARSIVMIAIGLVAALWALASLLHG